MTKNLNFVVFSLILILFLSLHSYTQLSTSLLSILPDGGTKEMLENFNKTQNSKVLLLSVKGFDNNAVQKIKDIEVKIKTMPHVSTKALGDNDWLQKHRVIHKFSIYPLDEKKLAALDIKKELETLYDEMSNSFFPVRIDREDPFSLLQYPGQPDIKVKNGYLTLGDYGYLTYFQLESDSLDTHTELYDQIHEIIGEDPSVKMFSPIFYYVENTNAIRSDVSKILWIAVAFLLFLYVWILRDISLLFNTLMTLATSVMFAIIVITALYGEVSIFVFVFGVSISSISIDYMFHHYLHGYYREKKPFNKEVFFGFLTTVTAFFILSFTSFLLIKQISLFSMISLAVAYVHFSFIYPNITFKQFHSKISLFQKNMQWMNAKKLLLFSLLIIIFSAFWVEFDFNLKNLDYDNKSLKKTERFFVEVLDTNSTLAFALKANTIDMLIQHAQTIQAHIPSAQVQMAGLVSTVSQAKNKKTLASFSENRNTLKVEASALGFKEGYFSNAYRSECTPVNYTFEQLSGNGIEIVKMDHSYITYGRVGKADYSTLQQYPFIESLSLKERFETIMKDSMNNLMLLGILALFTIITILYFITKKSMDYGLLFLIFPIAMLSVFAYFTPINILHIFMMFVILAIGIDYAIYLSKQSDALTKEAVAYSLVSTFAGFGVLIFSQINALFSLGVVASIGIISIFILLLFVRRTKYES